ncbi:hypothetical protein BH10ACT2_BH10ACT2_19490 [soil metagenome]
MTTFRKLLQPTVAALAIGALAASCSSTSKTTSDAGSTTTSSTTTTVSVTTTAATTVTAPATTAKPVATNPPATNPPATNPPPQTITSFSVSNAAACAAPDSSFVGPSPSVNVSWTVVGADSVTVSMDSEGGIWQNGLSLSGSTNVPASCDANGHNVHTYYVIAIKGGQKIASKKATRGS